VPEKYDMTLDEFLQAAGEGARRLNQKPSIINPKELARLQSVLNMMREIFAAEDVEITYKLFKPMIWDGWIYVRGKDLLIPPEKMERFKEAVDLADGLTVCPLVDGRLEILIGFDNITKTIKN